MTPTPADHTSAGDRSADELPESVALMWGRRPPGRRGPKPALTVEQIVDAAVAIADADGLDEVSMARVAERLGFTTMSLYRYVSSKDVLVELMMERAASDAPPAVPDAGWRPALRAYGRSLLAMYLDRPWMLRVPVTGPPIGPRQLAWLEAGLEAIVDTGIPEVERPEVVLLVTQWARATGTLAAELGQARPTDDEHARGERTYAAQLRALLGPDEFPRLRAAVESGAFDDDSGALSEADIEFGLDLILDGVATRVRPKRRRRSTRPDG